jgi:hypothetical protein
MADLKISQLSSATALAGTEVVPVVQGGATKKATIDQILSPASGKGINFSAAGGDTLNMYDEGTWTPVDTSGAGLTFDPGTTGMYTRIGNVVFVSASVRYPVTANANGASISGLPFAASGSVDGAQGGLTTNYSPFATPLVFKPNNGSTEMIPRALAGGAQQSNAALSGNRFDFSGFYFI